MSCRVLGPGVEETTLNLVAEAARRLGAQRLIGEYRPTAKNGMVREHYRKLGFSMSQEDDAGGRIDVLDVDTLRDVGDIHHDQGRLTSNDRSRSRMRASPSCFVSCSPTTPSC